MKKLKNLWVQNRVLFMLTIIVILCVAIILGVMVKYFVGTSKSNYGDRLNGIEQVKITDDIKTSFLEKMKSDELIEAVDIKTRGKIIYITLDFKEGVALVEAQSKALASLANFEQKYLDFYDFNFVIKEKSAEANEGFVLMGAKNVNGSGLVWNNNTEIKADGE